MLKNTKYTVWNNYCYVFLFRTKNIFLISGIRLDNLQSGQVTPSGFTSTIDLILHSKSYSNKDHFKRFICHSCPYSTNNKGHLKRHFLVHSGERPYKCEICNKGFTQSQDLRNHMFIHTGQKPYTCSVCSMTFRQSSTLKRHKTKHL